MTFLLGVLVGGVSGAVAGWAVSGRLAPIVAAVLHVVGRDADDRQVHFEAMQQ